MQQRFIISVTSTMGGERLADKIESYLSGLNGIEWVGKPTVLLVPELENSHNGNLDNSAAGKKTKVSLPQEREHNKQSFQFQ